MDEIALIEPQQKYADDIWEFRQEITGIKSLILPLLPRPCRLLSGLLHLCVILCISGKNGYVIL